jgi:peptidoglycan/LPS O-acetylase OafA/YrhL
MPTSVMDFIIVGCLLAIAQREPAARGIVKLADNRYAAWIATAALAAAYQLPGSYDNTFGVGAWILPSFGAIWAVLVVRRYVARPWLPMGKLLNSRIVVRFGLLSYSIYLWHIVFVNPYDKGILNRFPLSIVLAFGVAWLSREYVEKPFLRLKARRYRPARRPASVGRDDANAERAGLV